MNNQTKKISFILFISLVFFLFARLDFSQIVSSPQLEGVVQGESTAEDSALRVIFFDVGQGDSILIDTPLGRQILVDAGPDNAILEKLDKYLAWNDKSIDVIVLTHPHADHLDGFIAVLKRYEIKEVWLTGVVHTSSVYLEFLNLIKEKNISAKTIIVCEKESSAGNCGNTMSIEDGMDITFLWPDSDISQRRVDNLNNTSIVFRLVYGENSFLFTGDAEAEVLERIILLSAGEQIQSDVLKVAHHGSVDGLNKNFLDIIAPAYAVISVGRDNTYGHPSLRTVRYLERLGAEILRTDEHGDIIFTANKQKIFLTI